jgi:hypothetical protein
MWVRSCGPLPPLFTNVLAASDTRIRDHIHQCVSPLTLRALIVLRCVVQNFNCRNLKNDVEPTFAFSCQTIRYWQFNVESSLRFNSRGGSLRFQYRPADEVPRSYIHNLLDGWRSRVGSGAGIHYYIKILRYHNGIPLFVTYSSPSPTSSLTIRPHIQLFDGYSQFTQWRWYCARSVSASKPSCLASR